MMNRLQIIALKIAKKKKEPLTIFEKVFDEFKSDVKKYEKNKAELAISALKTTLNADLKKAGYEAELSISLGKFRGHYFVTSAKILISDAMTDKQVEKLLAYMIATYSPKFKYKGMEDDKHKFNIR